MIIRAHELTKGCVFKKQSVEYFVGDICGGKIYYGCVSGGSYNKKYFIGANSQEKVELISGMPSLKNLSNYNFYLCEKNNSHH